MSQALHIGNNGEAWYEDLACSICGQDVGNGGMIVDGEFSNGRLISGGRYHQGCYAVDQRLTALEAAVAQIQAEKVTT